MQDAGIAQEVIELFQGYYQLLEDSDRKSHYLWEKDIQPVQEKELTHRNQLDHEDASLGRSLLEQSVVIKLNGGLGTSMGMPYAKSLLAVKSGYSFLDIVLMQIGEGTSTFDPYTLVLMNSFNTHDDTVTYLEKKGLALQDQPFMFLQHKYPKILAASLEPAVSPSWPHLEWNPPGHGDFYAALFASGILDKLLSHGKRYAFISNIDNLGAVIDPSILGYFVRKDLTFLMEVAQRTLSDKKGGHLAKKDGQRFMLRELAQCPEEELPSFQDISRYRFFNTNNIWLDLSKVRSHIDAKGLPELPLIINTKTLNPRDESTPQVYQLETAIGSAISVFENSGAIEVTRERFIPVKTTNDLLAVRSDLYALNSEYRLIPNASRDISDVSIGLDSQFYKKIDQFDQRFPYGPPSLLACQTFRVQGDVLFEDEIICKDNVQVVNTSGSQETISAGSILTGEIVL
jgi:UTP--glucose-1-phosphate uridylyltransferase